MIKQILFLIIFVFCLICTLIFPFFLKNNEIKNKTQKYQIQFPTDPPPDIILINEDNENIIEITFPK